MLRRKKHQIGPSEELKAFLAMLFISSDIVVVSRDERYFLSPSETRLFHIPGVKNILGSRRRFFQLKSYIFFCDPDIQQTEEKQDPLYKVRGISHDIVQNFNELFFNSVIPRLAIARISFYAGKDDKEAGNTGQTGKIVTDLVADPHNTNHHLYVDNFYTSPILFHLLRARRILAAGTARPRKGHPYEQLKVLYSGNEKWHGLLHRHNGRDS